MHTSTMARSSAALLGAVCLFWQSIASAVIIPVEDDTQANETAAAVTYNYGHRQWFDVVGTASNNRWSYLYFGDVRDVLPAGTVAADVSRAVLHLYVSKVTGNGNAKLYAVTSSWDEGTHATGGAQASKLSWSNLPTASTTSLATINITSADEVEYKVVDVTNLVKDWITNYGNNYGLVLKPDDATIQVYFDSKENIGGGNNDGASHAPFLDVTLAPQNANLSAVAAGTWTGANSITTLGTIGTGMWNGTTIGLAYGGTGATTASGARTSLGLEIGTNVQAFDADLSDLADGSLTGSKVGSGISASNVTTGTLAVANGGSGSSNGSITGTGALTFTAGGSNTNITLTPNGTGLVVLSSDARINGIDFGLGGGSEDSNIAIGELALALNTTGTGNTAVGMQALYRNTIAIGNTAIGYKALEYTTTGECNTAVGADIMGNNTSGYSNTAVGCGSLYRNTTGYDNSVHGRLALFGCTTGHSNVAIGYFAGAAYSGGSLNSSSSVFIGTNTFGYASNDSNTIVIGANAVGEGTNTTVIGNSSTTSAHIYGTLTATIPASNITGIYGTTSSSGVAVYVNSSGVLGTLTSSRRFKQDIVDMNATSEAILSLRPVNFRYKEEFDSEAVPHFGLIAEEVAEVAPDLVARDKNGEIYTVRYEAVNAMLLNEFQKEHQRVQEQAAKIAAQQKQIDELSATVSELARQIRKPNRR